MTRGWHDKRVPPTEDCVLRDLLQRRALEMPDKAFVRFSDKGAWTHVDLLSIVRGWPIS
jgi:carnitine-CoA ligase